MLTENAAPTRRLSPVCLPSYRLGKRAHNAGKTYPAEVYSRREIEAIMAALGRGQLAIRNQAIVVAMWRCGLRVEEALALAGHDIDLEARTLFVRHGKFNRQRMLGVDLETAELLAAWLGLRENYGFEADEPLFPVCWGPTRGKKTQYSVFRETFLLAAKHSGLRKRAHCHGLRHTFASENVREGVPLPILSAMMGHLDVAYTFAYIRKVAPWEAIEAMQRRSWPELERRAPAPAGIW